jgi:hypothetical protein
MAPLGAYALSRLHVNWMLRAIIVINIFQLIYFNWTDPSIEKLVASVAFAVLLASIFVAALRHMANKNPDAS